MGNGKKRKRNRGRGVNGLLHLLQHILIAASVVAVLVVTTGSTVMIHGLSGNERYKLHASDQEKFYEESQLFNTIYGKAAADIIRFGVIRSQLETDGRFDGKKIIDVTAYNCRDVGIPEQYVTAHYYLEDLLKWQKYGLEYSLEYMTKEETEEFLNDRTIMVVMDPDSKYYNTTDASYMKSDVGAYTFVDDVSSNLLPHGTDDGGWFEELYGEEAKVNVLVNRYKTVDGKNIEEYTADLETYAGLCNNAALAMQSLAYNYEEYLTYLKYYDIENTNIRYCIEKTVGEHTEYFTNMEDIIPLKTMQKELPEKDMADYFAGKLSGRTAGNKDKYLYYSPSEMIYKTNSAIAEKTVRSIVKEYDYAYPENIRIWIGVDCSYPAGDAFLQGKTGFQNYLPYFWQWVALAAVAVILYFVLFFYLTMTTGREIDEEGKVFVKLSRFDRMPTEPALLFGVLSAAVIVWGGILVLRLNAGSLIDFEDIYSIWFKAAAGAVIFLLDSIFCFFFYSLVRRIRARVLWKNSYLKRIVGKCSVLLIEAYDNGNIITRTWVPFLIFVACNFLLVAVGFYSDRMVLGILIAFIIDIAIGVMLYRDVKERQDIVAGIEKIAEGNFSYQVEQERLHGDNLVLAKSVNSIGKGIKNAVEASMKDERMKTDLITNVSHDIKTPLTSIINYVDLIKREEIDNERVRSYIRVLDEKSQRLKQLTDDLVEASKISSGTINLHFEKINLTELLHQTVGEFSEKFEQKGLAIVMNVNTPNVVIEADSRRIWRVIENLFNNVYKYALEGTRVYISVDRAGSQAESPEAVAVSIKNISAMALNCQPEELTERFIRGDESRTTEGSGLGLSIAKNLTEAQHGKFEIQLDGDLFKVILTFPAISFNKL